MGAVGPPFCQKRGQLGVPLGEVGRPGVHHPQAEALDLFRPQAPAVPGTVLVPVALQVRGLSQRVHRVRYRAPQTLEPLIPGHTGIVLHNTGVGFKLGHAHILHLRAHRRNALGGHKDKHIAVEEILRSNHLHFREDIIVPGQANLPHFKLPPGRNLLGEVADADGGDYVPAQQLQPGEQGGAHIPDGQDIHPFFPRPGGPVQHLLPAGTADVDSGNPAVLNGLPDIPVQLQRDGGPVDNGAGGAVLKVDQAGGVQRRQTVPGQQLARVGHLEGPPPQHRVAGDGGEQPPAPGGRCLRPNPLQGGERNQSRAVDVVIIHGITPLQEKFFGSLFPERNAPRRGRGLIGSAATAPPGRSPGRRRRTGWRRSAGRCPCRGTGAG